MKTVDAFEAARLTELSRQPLRQVAEHFTRLLLRLVPMQATVGHCEISYTVPPFTIGMPFYDPSQVAALVREKLQGSGFTVLQAGPSLLVTWEETCSNISSAGKRIHLI